MHECIRSSRTDPCSPDAHCAAVAHQADALFCVVCGVAAESWHQYQALSDMVFVVVVVVQKQRVQPQLAVLQPVHKTASNNIDNIACNTLLAIQDIQRVQHDVIVAAAAAAAAIVVVGAASVFVVAAAEFAASVFVVAAAEFAAELWDLAANLVEQLVQQ